MKRIRTCLSFSICLLVISFPVKAQVSAHYINVGQAASALVEFKSGAILIDAGGESTSDDVYGTHLIKYLNDFFARRTDLDKTLDAVIISHPHLDHTKYLMTVMENFTVSTLIDNGADSGSGIAQLKKARQFAQDHDIEYLAVTNTRIRKKGKQLSLVEGDDAPKITLLSGLRNCENKNNDSIAVRITTTEGSFLFTGDSESEQDTDCGSGGLENLEDRFGSGSLLKADVYHVAHHGSFNGTTKDFMDLVTPKISIISAGDPARKTPGNFHAFQFGHPREVAVDLVERDTTGTRPTKSVTIFPAAKRPQARSVSKAVYCTCWDGDIVVKYAAGRTTPTVTTDETSVPHIAAGPPIVAAGQPGAN